MLTYISVKNFAIIENIEVSFNKGMTALTGETGAGKSLLIDAIGLLLGDRATSNIVRTGSNKAEVEGIFHIDNPAIIKELNRLDINHDGLEVIIKRQITPSNNNIIKINNQTVTLKDLREITSKMADIHTQLDTHRLINQDTYIDIIDGFERAKTDQLLKEYALSLKTYKDQLRELKRLESSNDDLIERLDLMRFQKQELESHNLMHDEEAELEDAVEKMENFDRIYQTLQQARKQIEDIDALGAIYDASKELASIADISESYQAIQKRFESNYFELDDAFETLKDELSGLDFNPRLLDQYQDRLNHLDSLKRKYRKSIPEIIEYLTEITNDIDNIDHYDDVINEQKEVVEATFKQVLLAAKKITTLRQKTSRYIEKELLNILTDLELSKTDFKVHFEIRQATDMRDTSHFFDSGVDEVDFLLTTNVGEPLKPLSKSASGGEMSRIMLGFKNLLTKSLGLSLIIFDEIDTGVSGYVAFQVANKMKEIAMTTQVLCITHIPQVAATSTHHLKISKTVLDGRTYAEIDTLEGETRIQEIAEMMSGDRVTNAAIESAKELLKK